MVVAEALAQGGAGVIGFCDDRADAVLASGSGALRHLGPVHAVLSLQPANSPLLLALGNVMVRRTLLARYPLLARTTATAIHPNASIAATSSIAPGVFIGPCAVVQARAAIAPHAIINTSAVIEHECHIGTNTHIAPTAVLGGRVHVGDDAFVGLGARVLPGIAIGDRAIVGAGAVVTRDVAPDSCVVGVPARAR